VLPKRVGTRLNVIKEEEKIEHKETSKKHIEPVDLEGVEDQKKEKAIP